MYKYPMLFHDVPLYAMIELYFFGMNPHLPAKQLFNRGTGF